MIEDRVGVRHINGQGHRERTKGQGHRRLPGMADDWEGPDRVVVGQDKDQEKANKLFKFPYMRA
jgi:hypothetical protein